MFIRTVSQWYTCLYNIRSSRTLILETKMFTSKDDISIKIIRLDFFLSFEIHVVSYSITLYRYLKENGSLQVESIAICDNIFTRRIYRTGYVLRCHCFKHFISRKLYFFIMECVQRYSYHLICHFIITESWHYGKRMFCTFSFPLGKSEKIENDNKQKRN